LLRDRAEDYNITVCGSRCEYSDGDSTAEEAACILPPVATTYSMKQFNISEPSVLKNFKYKSTSKTPELYFDGDI